MDYGQKQMFYGKESFKISSPDKEEVFGSPVF
jgi:hypothetical protein